MARRGENKVKLNKEEFTDSNGKTYKLDELIEYDFSDDCIRNKSYIFYIEKKGYDKYFKYKTTEKEELGDPDVNSKLLQEIYKGLWPEIINQNYMLSGEHICSDTMTSVQYTLSKYYQANFIDEIRKYKKEHPKQRKLTVIYANMYEQFPKVRDTLDKDENLKKFISVYHTLGNYSPVPIGFNIARSGGGTFDYWDLTLMKIKEFYDSRNEEKTINAIKTLDIIFQVLHDKKLVSCVKWLNSYSSWDAFVKRNYFHDYVEGLENEDGKAGAVIPFCKNHSWEAGCNDISDYEEFFKNATERIEKRSERMIKALKCKLEKNNL